MQARRVAQGQAVVGTPTVSDETLRYSYAKITDELAVGLCATCERVEDDLLIYFTSLEHNTAWVRVKVYDEKGKLRGESGLLRPGEYVERIPLASSPRGKTLKIKVLSLFRYKSISGNLKRHRLPAGMPMSYPRGVPGWHHPWLLDPPGMVLI